MASKIRLSTPVVGGEQSETISYWDPGMSMYKHAISLTCPNADTTVRDLATLQSSCPSVTPGVDGNYFSIASAERLGTAQTAQFQSGNQTGNDWHWGSRLNEAGDIIISTDSTNATAANRTTGLSAWHQGNGVWIENNSRAQMPRSYTPGDGIISSYYSWYATVAESGDFNSDIVAAKDSVCPSGWKLPIYGNSSTAKSWQGLLYGSYGLTNNGSSSMVVREKILSLTFSGYFSMTQGRFIVNSDGNWWSASPHDILNPYGLRITSSTVDTQYAASAKPNGFVVRCILNQ